MRVNNIDGIIIDEFRIFGEMDHPGCSSRSTNERIYREIKDLLIKRLNVRMTVGEIESRWKNLKRWWVNHQKHIQHRSYRGSQCTYKCPTGSARCVRMAFISVCDCYRQLYAKHQAALDHQNDYPLIVID